MKSRWAWALLVAVLGVAVYGGNVLATPGTGFTGTTLAKGQFDDIDARVDALLADTTPAGQRRHWLVGIKTQGRSDLYVQSNVWAPGGSTGWHTHPGPSLIIVTAGAVTAYESDDPTCTPHVYSQGMGFVDAGGGHVHVLRNEGSVEARTIAVQLVPSGADRRIDEPAPSTCPF